MSDRLTNPAVPGARSAETAPAPLLEVQRLRVAYGTPAAPLPVVRGISFTLGREKLGVVGESGSGKTTVGRALLRLLPPQAQVSAERLRFAGMDLLALRPAAMSALRGRRLSMIMQDPRHALNPVMNVAEQIGEALRRTDAKQDRVAVREGVERLLARVRIREPKRVATQYPHELSGGMGQRVMIAMMLAQRPELLIADEPASALDVSVRQDVLSLLDELVAEQGLAMLFISHDLELVRRFCDRVLVMVAGRVVETLPAAELHHAEHPYTRGLLGALPRLRQRRPLLPVLQRDAAWAEEP